MQESASLNYSYDTIGYTDPYLKSLVQHMRRSHTHTHTHTQRMCEIMRSAAESLVHYVEIFRKNELILPKAPHGADLICI